MEKSIIHTFSLSGKEAAGLEFLSGEEATGLESGEEAAGLESGEEVAGRSRLVFSELCILSSRTVKNSWVACSECQRICGQSCLLRAVYKNSAMLYTGHYTTQMHMQIGLYITSQLNQTK